MTKKLTEIQKINRKAKKLVAKGEEGRKELAKAGVSIDGHVLSERSMLNVMLIADKLANGESYLTLKKWIMEEFKVGPKQADNYYYAAMKYLAPKDIAKAREAVAAKLVANYEKLYMEAKDRGALSVAKDILDSLMKLYGLNKEQNKVQIAEETTTEGTQKVINITFD